MAAAYTNSLQALNGIYGALESIIKTLDALNDQDPKEKTKNNIKNLNRGSLNGIQEAERTSGSNNVLSTNAVRDISSALLSLPPAIKAVAGLGNRPIRNVVEVLDKLNTAFASLAVSNDALKGTIALKNLADSLIKLQEIKFFSLILSFSVLDKAKIGKKIGNVFRDIMDSYKSLGDITKEDMQAFEMFADGTTKLTTTARRFALMMPLMPMFLLSTAMFSPGLKILGKAISKMPEEEKVKSAIAAAEVLDTFVTGATTVILTSVGLAYAIKKIGKSEIILAIGITTTVITLLGGLVIAVTKTAGKSKNSVEQLKNVNDFINALAFTTGLIYGVSMLYVLGESIIKPGLLAVSITILSLSGLAVIIGMAAKLMHMKRSLRRVTNFIRSVVLMTGAVMAMAVFASVAKTQIMAGLGIVTGIILGLTLITMLVGAVSLITSKRGMLSVLGIAAFSLALVLGTMLIGAIITIPGAVETLLLGLGTVTAVLLAYTLIATIAGILGLIVEGLSPALMGVIKIAGFSLALVLGTMLIGAVVTQGWDLLLWGLGGVLGTLLAFEGIMILTGKIAAQAKILEMSGAWKDILLFAGGALLLTLGVVAIGALIHRVGIPWVIASLATVAGVLVGLRLIAIEAIAWGNSPTIIQGINALKQIGIFAAEVLAVTAGVVLIAKMIEGMDQKWLIAVSFGLMSAVMWEAYALAKAATLNKPTIDKGIIDFKSTIIMMGAAELLAFGLVGLAKVLADEDITLLKIGGAFALITAILFGAYGIAKLASKNKNALRKGAKDIKDAEILMGAAELLAFGIVGLAKSLEYVTLPKIIGAFGLVTAVLTEAYVLARLATKHKRTMRQGAKDIRDALLLMAGAEIVAGGVILLARALENTSTAKIFGAIGLMTAIIVEAGLLAAAASKIKGSITKGAVAILICEGLMLGAAIVLRAVIGLAKQGEGHWKDTWIALGEMTTIIVATGALAFAAGALLAGPQALLFAAGAAAMLACEGLVLKGTTMLTAVLQVTEQAKEVDFEKVKSTFEMMKEIIKLESGLMKEATKNIPSLLLGGPALKKVNNVIDSTCETISKFIMLSNYMQKAGMNPAELPDRLKEVLSAISPTIFLELFGKGPKGFISAAVKMQAGYKSYQKILNIVKSSLEMYANFIKTTKGKKIDSDALIETSTAIAESLSAFMTALGNNTIDVKKKTANKLNKALSELIEPVSNFAELITKYTGDGDTLAIITYDQNGVAHVGQKVDVIKTATVLVNAVMKFCSTLYDDNNKKVWEEIAGTKKAEQGSLESGIGIFAAIIEPMAKFAQVLTTFVDAGENTLAIPEYDEKGNLKKNLRKVNVVEISRTLANAVTTFINELYVNHMDEWTSVLNSLNMIDPTLAEGEEKAGNKSGLREAIGIFGEILNPVLNFASVLLKFGTDNNALTVFDEEGKPHKVDIAAVSGGIAQAVTMFIEKIAGIFNDNTLEAISKMNNNSASVINILNGFIDNVANAAQIDQKALTQSTALIPGFVLALTDSIKGLSSSISENEVLLFDEAFTKLSDILSLFITSTYDEESLTALANSTNTLQEVVKKTLTGIFVPEEIESFKLSTTDFINFINDSFTQLLSTIGPEDERFNAFLSSNKHLADGITDSLTTLFSTLSIGEELDVFVSNANTYKITIDDSISNFLKDIVKQDELDLFTNSISTFKETVQSSFDDIFGNKEAVLIESKIILFEARIKGAILMAFNSLSDSNSISQFTNAMSAISSSVRDVLGQSITDDSILRFQRIFNTIKASTEILINDKMVTDSDIFNKNLNSLLNNISSASEASKVKKVTTLGNAIKSTTGEMSKFDKTLENGNKKRIKDLDELGAAVEKISNKLKDAKDGLSNLKNTLTALQNADPNKINQVAQAVANAETSTSDGEEKRGGIFSGLGGGRRNKEQVPVIDYNLIAKAMYDALTAAFDGATLKSDEIDISRSDNKQTIKPTFTFDVGTTGVPDNIGSL